MKGLCSGATDQQWCFRWSCEVPEACYAKAKGNEHHVRKCQTCPIGSMGLVFPYIYHENQLNIAVKPLTTHHQLQGRKSYPLGYHLSTILKMWIHKLFQLCWPTYKLEVFQLPSRELTYPPKKWHFFEDDFPNFPFGGGICMLIPWEGNPVGDQPVDWVFKKNP